MGAIDGPCIFLFSMLSVFWVGGSPLSARGVPAQVLQPAAAPLCLSLFQTTIWGTGCYQPSVTEMTTCNLILSTPGLSLEKTLKLLLLAPLGSWSCFPDFLPQALWLVPSKPALKIPTCFSGRPEAGKVLCTLRTQLWSPCLWAVAAGNWPRSLRSARVCPSPSRSLKQNKAVTCYPSLHYPLSSHIPPKEVEKHKPS